MACWWVCYLKRALSLSYHLKNNFVQFSGETAIKSNKVAQYFQLFSNSKDIIWLGQFRLLPNSWETISGRPATGFGKTSNETGVLISVRKKIDLLFMDGQICIGNYRMNSHCQ